jgi:predicted RNA-binding protein with PIN domain
MSTTYYLDAYNIIHGSKPLKELAKKSIDAARNSFIKLVAEYCTVSNEKMVLVFDGAGDPATLARYRGQGGNLRIEYCENAMSADTYIGRALYAMHNRLNAVVVTADVAVAQSARGMGALVVAPQSFINQVESTLSESRTSRKPPARERFGVTLSDKLSVDAKERLQSIRTAVTPEQSGSSAKRRPKNQRAGPKTGS